MEARLYLMPIISLSVAIIAIYVSGVDPKRFRLSILLVLVLMLSCFCQIYFSYVDKKQADANEQDLMARLDSSDIRIQELINQITRFRGELKLDYSQIKEALITISIGKSSELNITKILDKKNVPENVIFLIDASRSMAPYMQRAKDVLIKKLKKLRKDQKVSLLFFRDQYFTSQPLNYFDLKSVNHVDSLIAEVKPNDMIEYTYHDIQPAINAVVKFLEDYRGQIKELQIFTDYPARSMLERRILPERIDLKALNSIDIHINHFGNKPINGIINSVYKEAKSIQTFN